MEKSFFLGTCFPGLGSPGTTVPYTVGLRIPHSRVFEGGLARRSGVPTSRGLDFESSGYRGFLLWDMNATQAEKRGTLRGVIEIPRPGVFRNGVMFLAFIGSEKRCGILRSPDL